MGILPAGFLSELRGRSLRGRDGITPLPTVTIDGSIPRAANVACKRGEGVKFESLDRVNKSSQEKYKLGWGSFSYW